MPTATATARKRPSTKKPAHPLAHLVPPMTKAEEYVPRAIGGVKDVDLLVYAGKSGHNVLMTGPTGLGKSHMVAAYAAAYGLPMVVVEARDGIDPATFFGGWVPKDGGGFTWEWSDVSLVAMHGGVLFIDELNFMKGRVSAAFHRMMREGQFSVLEKGNELITCSPDLQIIGAMNDGYEGTYPLNQAFRNRFSIKLELEYDRAVEQSLLYCPSLLDLAEKLRSPDTALDSPISTNMLMEFERLAGDVSVEFAVLNFLNAFDEEERPVVRELLNLHRTAIDTEVQAMLEEQ